MNKELILEIERMKELFKYNFLCESMQISKNFTEENYGIHNNVLNLEVATDPDNENQHRLNLIVQFSNASKYLELIFYFNVTNLENTKITSEKTTLYSRDDVKKYLPKELIGNGAFTDKLLFMINHIFSIQKPNIFFMETYDEYKIEKDIQFHRKLIPAILKNGYNISEEGANINKRYFWKFELKTIKELGENIKEKFVCPIKDEAYWKIFNKEAQENLLKPKTMFKRIK